ncbi:FAD-binding monooxygenase [Planotetraspora sp. A-T 1434]|uniref:FAD-dependent oxidoreductase n=1 Tax=Planotetraspora sp. A-T 1434 TaxID=2979219 RepID=UPI0021BEF8A3|nr:FAD-dependent monooxygenase [Planotetraspora sp. A-T 1434]MCT9933175.1 FAD-binding monooxygenase [Planotetraspora sp. A-T 1434]
MGDVAKTRAVVLGGSLAGLFAARVLADAYDEVLIIDRDVLIGVEGPRRGCPQSRHINGLLARGQQAMEEMYPGITQELFADGVPTGDLAGHVRWYFNGKRLKQQQAGLICVASSRPKLEHHIRERTRAFPNVVFAERHDILGLETTVDRSRVTGVRVQPLEDGAAEKIISADLVVDATGRGSRTPIWLEALGYPRVEEERKKIGLGYVTQHYRLTADPYHGDLSINPVASPALPRGAIFTKTDGGRVELTTYGILGDHPPTDQEGLYEWIKSLAVPDIYDALQHAEPLDEPVAFRFPTTLRRRYEKLNRFPDGLLVTGDAVCCFNPVYAQGMTVAALGALVIRQHLHTGAVPDPFQYFKDLASNVIDQPWEMTNIVDLSFPGVEGERPLQVRMAQAFLGLVQTAATRDSVVAAAYMRGAGLIDGPEALMRPPMLLRILLNALPWAKDKPEPPQTPPPWAPAETPAPKAEPSGKSQAPANGKPAANGKAKTAGASVS